MALNSTRKDIQFMVQGALPPHDTNVMWMDTSNPTLPVLKIFEAGAWVPVHTDNSKAIDLLTKTVYEQAKALEDIKQTAKTGTNSDATNTAILDAVENIELDTSDLAKEDTLTTGISDIRNDISHIDIDTSDLAKESSVKDGNDTAIGMLKDQTNGLAAIKTQAANAASDAASVKTLVGTPASGQPSNLFAAISAIGSDLIKSFHLVNIDGYTFVDLVHPAIPGSIIFDNNKLAEIYDESVAAMEEAFSYNSTYPFWKNLKKIALPNCTTVKDIRAFPSVEEIDFRSATSEIGYYYWYGSMPKLKRANFLKVQFNNIARAFDSDPNLIDLITGVNFNASTSGLNYWNPTEALRTDSISLLDDGDTFSSNREKLLYNIREHIAANLPDLTGQTSLTLTFHANIKAAIQADTATSNAFTNKNWVIA